MTQRCHFPSCIVEQLKAAASAKGQRHSPLLLYDLLPCHIGLDLVFSGEILLKPFRSATHTGPFIVRDARHSLSIKDLFHFTFGKFYRCLTLETPSIHVHCTLCIFFDQFALLDAGFEKS